MTLVPTPNDSYAIKNLEENDIEMHDNMHSSKDNITYSDQNDWNYGQNTYQSDTNDDSYNAQNGYPDDKNGYPKTKNGYGLLNTAVKEKHEEGSTPLMDSWGVTWTIIMCSMGTPMLGVSFMAAQLGPYLAILAFGIAAVIAAECGRLAAITCGMWEEYDRATQERNLANFPNATNTVLSDIEKEGDCGCFETPKKKNNADADSTRKDFNKTKYTSSNSTSDDTVESSIDAMGHSREYMLDDSSPEDNQTKEDRPWIFPDYTARVFGPKSYIPKITELTTVCSLYGICVGGFAAELTLLETGSSGILNFVGDTLNGVHPMSNSEVIVANTIREWPSEYRRFLFGWFLLFPINLCIVLGSDLSFIRKFGKYSPYLFMLALIIALSAVSENVWEFKSDVAELKTMQSSAGSSTSMMNIQASIDAFTNRTYEWNRIVPAQFDVRRNLVEADATTAGSTSRQTANGTTGDTSTDYLRLVCVFIGCLCYFYYLLANNSMIPTIRSQTRPECRSDLGIAIYRANLGIWVLLSVLMLAAYATFGNLMTPNLLHVLKGGRLDIESTNIVINGQVVETSIDTQYGQSAYHQKLIGFTTSRVEFRNAYITGNPFLCHDNMPDNTPSSVASPQVGMGSTYSTVGNDAIKSDEEKLRQLYPDTVRYSPFEFGEPSSIAQLLGLVLALNLLITDCVFILNTLENVQRLVPFTQKIWRPFCVGYAFVGSYLALKVPFFELIAAFITAFFILYNDTIVPIYGYYLMKRRCQIAGIQLEGATSENTKHASNHWYAPVQTHDPEGNLQGYLVNFSDPLSANSSIQDPSTSKTPNNKSTPLPGINTPNPQQIGNCRPQELHSPNHVHGDSPTHVEMKSPNHNRLPSALKIQNSKKIQIFHTVLLITSILIMCVGGYRAFTRIHVELKKERYIFGGRVVDLSSPPQSRETASDARFPDIQITEFRPQSEAVGSVGGLISSPYCVYYNPKFEPTREWYNKIQTLGVL